MNIVGRFLIAVAGAATAAGVALVGCGTTNNLETGGGTSGPGESCTRSFDCKAGYVCESNVCFAAVTVDGGGDGGDAAPASGPHLGLLDQSCQTSTDCQAPLACINNECRVVDYGLTVTGKSCSGECNTPDDCCELPVNFHPSLYEWYLPTTDGGLPVFHYAPTSYYPRCEDLLAYIGGNPAICDNPANFTIDSESLATGCFDYKTYCACATPSPWACTNNRCSYAGACSTASAAAACPTLSRAGYMLNGNCNVPAAATTGTCTAGCAMDSDCSGKYLSASEQYCSLADAGGGTNCTCYQSSCYFKCAKDLDCASGSTCDSATHLCKASTACAADSDCIQQLSNPQGRCVANACAIACDNDTECNPPGTICSAGFCKASGCNSDLDCPATSGARLFCVPASTTGSYSSAITN